MVKFFVCCESVIYCSSLIIKLSKISSSKIVPSKFHMNHNFFYKFKEIHIHKKYELRTKKQTSEDKVKICYRFPKQKEKFQH